MPRLYASDEVLPQIGKVIADASLDASAKAKFEANPAEYLKSAGIPEEQLAGKKIVVHADDADTLHVVVPSAVNADLVESRDEDYLSLLGAVTVRGCR
ncbi:MAG: hypothetical protein AAGL24_17945 [Pseudomonadota bacterium]